MAIVSLFVPIVLAYIFYAWRALEKTGTTIDEINDAESHAY
jgi:cytochrome d ubiquinol oxidase subunit II